MADAIVSDGLRKERLSKMLFNKITHGHVIQTFNDAGECIKQEFIAGDPVEYETSEGDPINLMDMPKAGNEYFPFDMKQPLEERYI